MQSHSNEIHTLLSRYEMLLTSIEVVLKENQAQLTSICNDEELSNMILCFERMLNNIQQQRMWCSRI